MNKIEQETKSLSLTDNGLDVLKEIGSYLRNPDKDKVYVSSLPKLPWVFPIVNYFCMDKYGIFHNELFKRTLQFKKTRYGTGTSILDLYMKLKIRYKDEYKQDIETRNKKLKIQKEMYNQIANATRQFIKKRKSRLCRRGVTLYNFWDNEYPSITEHFIFGSLQN